jgi:aminoglycoside 3-N-acetyltransferase
VFNKDDIIKSIINLGIKPTDTLLVHSSMKSIGAVEGGADTVIDAFKEYLKEGLLVFPTHSWAKLDDDDYTTFNVLTEPSCVGLLSNLFLKRPIVFRSWHPTHSVAAVGKDAESFVSGEENSKSPCSRTGCWGKLYDRKAKILFLGCTLKSNTFIHGVEEWNNIPLRILKLNKIIKIITPQGQIIDCALSLRHRPDADVSENYDKMEAPFLAAGIAEQGLIGDARSVLCDAAGMAELTTAFLKINPQLFIDDSPVPLEWYIHSN